MNNPLLFVILLQDSASISSSPKTANHSFRQYIFPTIYQPVRVHTQRWIRGCRDRPCNPHQNIVPICMPRTWISYHDHVRAAYHIRRLCSRYICRLFGRLFGTEAGAQILPLFIIATLPSKTSSGFPQNSPTMATPHAMFSIESRSGREVGRLLRYGSSTGVCQNENGRGRIDFHGSSPGWLLRQPPTQLPLYYSAVRSRARKLGETHVHHQKYVISWNVDAHLADEAVSRPQEHAEQRRSKAINKRRFCW